MVISLEYLAVYIIGAAGYSLLEILWRGYTHWTMALTGGVCFFFIYMIHTRMTGINLWVKCFLCALLVTSVEFIVGSVVNLQLHWGVWDYSDQPLNLYGQICALYSMMWYFLALPLAPVCRFLHRMFIA